MFNYKYDIYIYVFVKFLKEYTLFYMEGGPKCKRIVLIDFS